MAKKTVKLILNIGLDDVKIHGLERVYARDEIVSPSDHDAEVLIKHGWAKEYTDTVKQEDEESRRRDIERAKALAMPAAIRDAIKKKVESEIKIDVPKDSKPAAPEEPVVSPVADRTADDAITSIKHMSDKDKLQSIVDADRRTTVQAAARERLAAL